MAQTKTRHDIMWTTTKKQSINEQGFKAIGVLFKVDSILL